MEIVYNSDRNIQKQLFCFSPEVLDTSPSVFVCLLFLIGLRFWVLAIFLFTFVHKSTYIPGFDCQPNEMLVRKVAYKSCFTFPRCLSIMIDIYEKQLLHHVLFSAFIQPILFFCNALLHGFTILACFSFCLSFPHGNV